MAVHVLGIDTAWLRLRWRVHGTLELMLPPATDSGRADGLWQSTCFEAFFLGPEDPAAGTDGPYVELNLSPSGRWNAYNFNGYREGMAPRPMACAPTITMHHDRSDADGTLIFDAAVPLATLPPLPCRLGLTAVLEEQGGIKSYWALAHPSADTPDFHATAGFTARLHANGVQVAR